MFNNILPKEVQNISITKNNNQITGYDTIFQRILIDINDLRYRIETKLAVECYLNIRLTLREFFVFCLFHELAHAYQNRINSPAIRDWEKFYSCFGNFYDTSLPVYKQILNYWEQLPIEKEAQAIASKWFFKYRELIKRAKLNE
jgi:hypothetical protein